MPIALGYDIGSSSIKCALFDYESGKLITNASYPPDEMEIRSPKPGWAEQDPESWWEHVKTVTKMALSRASTDPQRIMSIGISYQMHGLVLVDKEGKVLRPSIIWCDSRAVEIGNKAFEAIGPQRCLEHLLNSPGNFTASKLRWVKENEPKTYDKIFKAMLPGDYIAYRLTGEISSTISGMSEGMFWDFRKNELSRDVLTTYEIDAAILPTLHPTFSVQGTVTRSAAQELGLKEGIAVSYRAGDQPNNALSLHVLQPGEIAATAGTSGVVYGVIDQVRYDRLSRVNQFAHVNHSNDHIRLGVLLCVNGTGILNSWLRKNAAAGLSYDEMNRQADRVPIGADGLSILPFGNGAERVLENRNIGSRVLGLDFNRHSLAHIVRAAQEGIAFSLKYGVDIMNEMGLNIRVIRAGRSNMFLSPVFRQTFSTVTGAAIELYDTDGAQGAARGAAVGSKACTFEEAFRSFTSLDTIEPREGNRGITLNAYNRWVSHLNRALAE